MRMAAAHRGKFDAAELARFADAYAPPPPAPLFQVETRLTNP
jgi:hypothetical protein